jgi:hypothetical protein
MKAIQILGKTYKIEYVDNKTLGGNYGDCNTTKAYIRINKEITKQQQEDTLLHEVLHIISDELKIELEERQVHPLATALYSIGVRV